MPKRLVIVLLADVLSCGVAAAPAAHAAKTRACGDTGTDVGGAVKISAIRVSCQRARQLMRACLRGERIGWRQRPTGRIVEGPNTPLIEFRRGDARIFAGFVGAGGCSG